MHPDPSNRTGRRLLVAAIALAAIGLAHRASAADTPACTSTEVNPENQAVACTLVAPGGSERYRMRIDFVGSHDDTRASLAASLDGRPQACAAGSKTSLFGEDGNVSLVCELALDGAAGTRRTLEVVATYTHCQYGGFVFTAD